MLTISASAQLLTSEAVGIPQELSYMIGDKIQSTTGFYPTLTVVTKKTNGVITSKNIAFYLKSVTMYPTAFTSQLVENELRYYTRTSSNTYERAANPINRKGNRTNLPKSKIIYSNTSNGSTKSVRDETLFYTFVCLAYDFMIGKTPSEIAVFCQVDNVTFKGGESVAIAGTGINFTATAQRVAKDCFILNPTPAKLWDKCTWVTTSATCPSNEVSSIFPRLELIGDTLYNRSWINGQMWSTFNLIGLKDMSGILTYSIPNFTYRMKLLNGCTYPNMTEAQAILGFGMLGQCEGYSDFYWDSTKNADEWKVVNSTSPRIDKATNTIYCDKSKPCYIILEMTSAPKNNPNAKVWATDICFDLRDSEQHGDYLIWFSDKN